MLLSLEEQLLPSLAVVKFVISGTTKTSVTKVAIAIALTMLISGTRVRTEKVKVVKGAKAEAKETTKASAKEKAKDRRAKEKVRKANAKARGIAKERAKVSFGGKDALLVTQHLVMPQIQAMLVAILRRVAKAAANDVIPSPNKYAKIGCKAHAYVISVTSSIRLIAIFSRPAIVPKASSAVSDI